MPRTHQLQPEYDVLAPDGAEIRILLANDHMSVAHGTLPPGGVSLAITHRMVEEIWYVLSGHAELWRKQGDDESVTKLIPDSCVDIPLGTHFQFRTIGDESFEFIMTTTPPWPGEDEAIRVPDHWHAEPD